jgi:hypothetical protein
MAACRPLWAPHHREFQRGGKFPADRENSGGGTETTRKLLTTANSPSPRRKQAGNYVNPNREGVAAIREWRRTFTGIKSGFAEQQLRNHIRSGRIRQVPGETDDGLRAAQPIIGRSLRFAGHRQDFVSILNDGSSASAAVLITQRFEVPLRGMPLRLRSSFILRQDGVDSSAKQVQLRTRRQPPPRYPGGTENAGIFATVLRLIP